MNPANLALLVTLHQGLAEALNAFSDYQRAVHQCEQQSRIIAALVAEHGGAVRRAVWDRLDQQTGFAGYTVRADADYVEIVLDNPVLTLAGQTVADQAIEQMSDEFQPGELIPIGDLE